MTITTRLLRLFLFGAGSILCSVLTYARAADMPPMLPDIDQVERFELTDARLTDATLQITSTNRAALKQLIGWLQRNAPPPYDPNWQGSYRPILTVRLWQRDRSEPAQISITHEWKDMQGKVWTLDDAKVTALMRSILTVCKLSESRGGD